MKRSEFDVLVYLEGQKGERMPSQRKIAAETGLASGTVSKAMGVLLQQGWISKEGIADQGLAALEPYRAKRAIFIAAGIGERLIPITLNTPKPLVRVGGVRMIDTMLDAVTAAGIEEIIVVRGYLGEQFDQLLYKYPGIKFVENPLYNVANNISSFYQVRHMLAGAYVMDSDLYLRRPELITKYQYGSNYLGIPVERSDDWCLETRNGYITRMMQGGRNTYLMVGVSYWSEADGARLEEHAKSTFEMPGGRERFWDQVALDVYAKHYRVAVRPCKEGDIIEIDNFSSLQELDSSYKTPARTGHY